MCAVHLLDLVAAGVVIVHTDTRGVVFLSVCTAVYDLAVGGGTTGAAGRNTNQLRHARIIPLSGSVAVVVCRA